MPEISALDYFLIVLGGFGMVWGFRHFSGANEKRITEFEYAAFSTIWGIIVFGIFIWIQQENPKFPELLKQMNDSPAIATPSLFILGAFCGSFAGSIFKTISTKYSHWHWLKKIRRWVFWWEGN